MDWITLDSRVSSSLIQFSSCLPRQRLGRLLALSVLSVDFSLRLSCLSTSCPVCPVCRLLVPSVLSVDFLLRLSCLSISCSVYLIGRLLALSLPSVLGRFLVLSTPSVDWSSSRPVNPVGWLIEFSFRIILSVNWSISPSILIPSVNWSISPSVLISLVDRSISPCVLMPSVDWLVYPSVLNPSSSSEDRQKKRWKDKNHLWCPNDSRR